MSKKCYRRCQSLWILTLEIKTVDSRISILFSYQDTLGSDSRLRRQVYDYKESESESEIPPVSCGELRIKLEAKKIPVGTHRCGPKPKGHPLPPQIPKAYRVPLPSHLLSPPPPPPPPLTFMVCARRRCIDLLSGWLLDFRHDTGEQMLSSRVDRLVVATFVTPGLLNAHLDPFLEAQLQRLPGSGHILALQREDIEARAKRQRRLRS